jgi:adenylyl-sulfate kinase
VIWLTGLSAAGKTTIAQALQAKLSRSGVPVRGLDGDELRRTISAELGFSADDRSENVRRAARMAARYADDGYVCIVALISPLQAQRAEAEAIIGADRFVEVYVATPIDVCRARDPKGLYARADRGEMSDFTGVSAPYEPPIAPKAIVQANRESVDECVDRIWRVMARTRTATPH